MFRKLIFWPHLVVGIVTGLVVFMLCLTGAAITFDKQIVTWVEMDGHAGPPSADSRRLPPEVLAANAARWNPAKVTNIEWFADPQTAARVSFQDRTVVL